LAWCRSRRLELRGRGELGESGVFGSTLGEPDVVVGHRAAMTLFEGGGSAFDQALGVGPLSGEGV
jgi:hypothetical protein